MNTALVHFLQEIERSGFYGSIELKFENSSLARIAERARPSNWILFNPTVEIIEETMPSNTETDPFDSRPSIIAREITTTVQGLDSETADHAIPEDYLLQEPVDQPKPGPEPTDNSKSKGNFIEKYRAYADIMEAPPEAHEVVAMGLIAAALNRNGVTIRHGAVQVSMDLWTLLISESGFSRGTPWSASPFPILREARTHRSHPHKFLGK